jgi:anaerobic selenocysteine-containing dehydrogenase
MDSMKRRDFLKVTGIGAAGAATLAAPAIAQSLTEVATLDSNLAAPMTASQKTRCMMPAAQWKGCGA